MSWVPFSSLHVFAKPQSNNYGFVYFVRPEELDRPKEGSSFIFPSDWMNKLRIQKIKDVVAFLFSDYDDIRRRALPPSPLISLTPRVGAFSYCGPAEGLVEAIRKSEGYLLFDQPKRPNPFVPWRYRGTSR